MINIDAMYDVVQKVFTLFLNKKLAMMWFIGAGLYPVPDGLDHLSETLLGGFRASALLWSMLVILFT